MRDTSSEQFSVVAEMGKHNLLAVVAEMKENNLLVLVEMEKHNLLVLVEVEKNSLQLGLAGANRSELNVQPKLPN